MVEPRVLDRYLDRYLSRRWNRGECTSGSLTVTSVAKKGKKRDARKRRDKRKRLSLPEQIVEANNKVRELQRQVEVAIARRDELIERNNRESI